MLHPRLSLAPFLALALGSSAAAQLTLPESRLSSPFVGVRTLAVEGGTALELAYDPAAAQAQLRRAHQAGAPVVLEHWLMPDGQEVELALRPFAVMPAGAAAVVHRADGTLENVAPTVLLFAGHAVGHGGRAFLALAPEQVNGYVELDRNTWVLSSGGDRGDGRALLAPAGGATTPDWCATVPAATPDEGVQRFALPQLRHAPVFMELDNKFRNLFASDAAAINYCVTLVGASSEIYRRDLGVLLEIPNGYINVWHATPPWGVITTFGDVASVADWWASPANPNRQLDRAAVHVLTNPVFGGVASSIASLCSVGNGYEISSVNGFFPFPVQHTNPNNWDLFVVSHEFGHTFGANHTHDLGVDCDDGTGPDQGTIMGYCHLTFGVGGVGMRFHHASQEEIRLVVGGRPCLTYQPIERGDHDGDGDFDALDLAEFDAFLGQGFFSMASLETFDMDLDGTVDTWDRAVLAARVAGMPAATALERVGSGVNDTCYFSLGAPVLGSLWQSLVSAPASARPTFILGMSQPHAGLSTPFGELLVRTPALGGVKLFQLARPTTGFFAEYDVPVPEEPALAGLQAYTQALVLLASGPQLCNAVDVRFGFY